MRKGVYVDVRGEVLVMPHVCVSCKVKVFVGGRAGEGSRRKMLEGGERRGRC